MRKRILDSQVITANHTTEWCDCDGGNSLFKPSYKDFTVQVNWLEGVGTATNSKVEVLGTLNGLETKLATYDITTLNNTSDVLKFNFNSIVSAIKLKFTIGNITSLKLNADIDIN